MGSALVRWVWCGVPDTAQAAQWIRAAALANTPDGLFTLGTFYANGWGVSKDMAQASAWYHLSYVAGHPDGERLRDEAISRLSHSQQLQAHRIVRNFVRPLRTKESPREIIAADYTSSGGELPITGGWGYTKSDACVIDMSDPIVNSALPFNGIGIEKIFVERRIHEEMIIFRRKGDQFSGIRWDLKIQRLFEDGNREFDKLEYEITGFHDEDWNELKAEYEGPEGVDSPSFNAEAHEHKRQGTTVKFSRDFWFDITSFFGKS